MSFLFIQEMEKLQLKHIGPYLPYGLQVQIIETGNNRKLISVNANESVVLAAADLNPFSFPRCKPVTGIKPILRPLSDLYKEIDGKVGIVELAKISFDMGDNNPLVTEGAGVYDCRFDDKIFLFNSVGLYFSAYRSTDNIYWSHIACPNQLEMFTYLFQHHYDVFSLIDKGLAIDLNSISHE